jgi:DNA polymerase I
MRDAVAALKENGFKTRLLVQVHDELLFETPQKELARAARLIREKMEKALHLAVPLIVDLKIGPNWSDMEKTEE